MRSLKLQLPRVTVNEQAGAWEPANIAHPAFFLLLCVVAPLRETFFLLFSQCGLALPLCEDFLPHATTQR